MAREIFQIEDGKLYLSVVDTDAVGYDTSWLAPGGDNVTEVTAADYSTGVRPVLSGELGRVDGVVAR